MKMYHDVHCYVRAAMKRSVALLLLLSLLLCIIPAHTYAEGEDSALKCNVVLLIDKSGSMNRTDANGVAKEAAGMFINVARVYTEEAGGGDHQCNVGAIAFSDDVRVLSAPVNVSDEAAANDLAERIDSIEYDKLSTGGTDLGLALKTALDMLSAAKKDGYANMIIMLTDGYTDGLSRSRLEESEQMLEESLKGAGELDSEILVIGWNHEGRITEEGRAQIWRIANETQTSDGIRIQDVGDATAKGKVNYLLTNNTGEVMAFYHTAVSKLFSSRDPVPLLSDPNNPEIYEIEIAERVNVIISIYLDEAQEDREIGEIALIDTNGDEVDFNTDTYLLTRGAMHALILMREPKLGKYLLRLDENVEYKVSMSSIDTGEDFNIVGTATADINTGNLSVILTTGIGDRAEKALYDSLPVSEYMVINSDIGYMQTHQLYYDNEEGCFAGTFTVERPGVYEVRVGVGDERGVEQTTCELEFTPGSTTLGRQSVAAGGTQTLELPWSFYAGWDNVEYRITDVVCEPEGFVSAAIEEGEVKLKGLKQGEAEITVYVEDNFQQLWGLDGSIDVKWNALLLIPIVLAVLAAVWLAVRLNTKLNGSFEISIMFENRLIASESDAAPPKGREFSLYKLLKSCFSVKSVVDTIDSYKRELSKSDYKISVASYKMGKKKIKEYRYGKGKDALVGDMFNDDKLRISVVYNPDDSGWGDDN